MWRQKDVALKWRLRLFPKPASPAWGEDDHLFPDLYNGEALLDLLVMTQVAVVAIVVIKSGLQGFSWALLAQVSALAMGIALFSAFALTICEGFLIKSQMFRSAMFAGALVLTATALSAIAGEQAMIFVFPDSRFSWPRVYEMVVIAVAPAVILLRYLFMHQNYLVQERAEEEARVQAHQARIRPHFLFNSMNMIASLIGSDPEKAERVVEDLSDLFREILAGSEALVPLRDELSLCRKYLNMEKMRLGGRLQVEWQIGDYGDDAKIPSLTLQPVLENAVYHGIQLMQQPGKIEIKIRREKDEISIEVRNPRNPRLEHNTGSKMAIKNVQYRLKAHFGSDADVRSEMMDEHYTTRISYRVSA